MLRVDDLLSTVATVLLAPAMLHKSGVQRQKQSALYRTVFQVCSTLLQKWRQSQEECRLWAVLPCRGPRWDPCLPRLSSKMGRMLMLAHLGPQERRYSLMKPSYHVSPSSAGVHSICRCNRLLTAPVLAWAPQGGHTCVLPHLEGLLTRGA